MERIKVNIGSGSSTIPTDQWEQGYDLAETLLWAKQNDSINMEIPTDTHLHVPVARPSVVKALGGVVEVDDSLVQFEDKEVMNVLLNKMGETLLTVSAASTITSIGTWFKGNTNIVNVDLSVLPNVKVISDAFTSCTNLKRLDCGNATSLLSPFRYVTGIEELVIHKPVYCGRNNGGAFENTGGLKKLIIPNVETILKFSVNTEHTVYNLIFAMNPNCKLYLLSDESTPLTSLIIPSSITQINAYALYGLNTITALSYEGSVSEWLAISKGGSWHAGVPVAYIQCTDGKAGLDDTIETGNTYQ